MNNYMILWKAQLAGPARRAHAQNPLRDSFCWRGFWWPK